MSDTNNHRLRLLVFLLSIVFFVCGVAHGQGTAFTYEGKLTDAGNLVNAQYDMQFKLFDTMNVGTGTQQGSTFTNPNVQVTSGGFTVTLDFSASVFDGSPRYLEIGLRPAGSPDPYTILAPRQQLTSTPYAIKSLKSATADGLSVACVSCVTSSQIQSVQGSQVTGNIAGSQIQGTIPVASMPAGNSNYIQNTTAPQSSSNFNISGNGTIGGNLNVSGAFTLNIVNANSQYNLGGTRILSNPGIQNLFAGVSAGAGNTSGCCSSFFGFHAGAVSNANDNSFFGNNAGAATTSGSRNSFFGSAAGFSNVSGNGNSFFGVSAGQNNTGNSNSFFGDSAGFSNTTGAANSFIGNSAGFLNTAGVNNSFFGFQAGRTNNGDNNSFFGVNAGFSNTASGNSFFGYRSGFANTNQTLNTFIGFNAGTNNGSGDSTGSANSNTFIGSQAGLNNTLGGLNTFVGSNAGFSNSSGADNSFFGNQAGSGNTTGSHNSFFGVVAGETNTSGSNNSFFGNFAGRNSAGGNFNSFFGDTAGQFTQTGSNNSFFGSAAGGITTTGSTNSFFGAHAGFTNDSGSNNTVIGANADVGANNLSFATAIGAGTTVSSSNTIKLGRDNDDDVLVGNRLTVHDIPLLSSSFSVCTNAAGDILHCGASSLRWKRNIQPFPTGLDVIRRLRPISFIWKEDGRADFGLGAEDVAKVAPNLVFTNKTGEVEGVKYEKLNLLLINAVKEQQQTIEAQQRQIKSQQQQLNQQQQAIIAIKKWLSRRNGKPTSVRHNH